MDAPKNLNTNEIDRCFDALELLASNIGVLDERLTSVMHRAPSDGATKEDQNSGRHISTIAYAIETQSRRVQEIISQLAI